MSTNAAFAEPISVWSPADRPPHLAIAEDDDDIRDALTHMLVEDGFAVTPLATGEALVKHLELCRERKRPPDLIVLDHLMPGWCGLEILQAMEANGWTVPVILMTAFGRDVTTEAVEHGACAVFEKPFDVNALVAAVCQKLGFHVESGPHEQVSAPTLELSMPRCAACREVLGVRIEAKSSGVYFCTSCWERARPPLPEEDIGVSD